MSAACIPDSLSERTYPGYNLSQSFAQSSLTAGTVYAQESGEHNQGRLLTKKMVLKNLSCLGLIGSGTAYAYLHLSLPNHALVDISLIASYPNLQRLDLSSNQLSDVAPLGNLHYLTHLNLSGNKLTAVLDFDPPKALKEVDYGYNEIEEIPSLKQHQSLTRLTLDGNQITLIEGLGGLPSLSYLSIADNRLEVIENLDHLPLKYLNLSGNCIKEITNLKTLKLLKVLNLSYNQIHSLSGIQGHRYLSDLNMEDNEVVSVSEVEHLQDLEMLTKLSLKRNPVQALGDYRQTVLIQLPSLTTLDDQLVTVEEKVAAQNRFNPPMSLVAAHNHMIHTSRAARKPARLRFSTLTRLDEPYPMLVLCGPPGSGKGQFCHTLVEEFPSFFGLGVSHTTRPQGTRESHGRDYYFINEATFNRAADAGEFIQTCKISDYWYGLTMAAVEQVAQQGLACVTHMSIEGVLTLKNSHFEPRYILTMPLTNQIHDQRLKARECYSDNEITQAIADIKYYRRLHQELPGFFDAAINTDSLHEGYNILRTIVMAYGGITPETPLTLSLSASRPTTHQTSSSYSSDEILDHDTTADTTQPTTAVGSQQYHAADAAHQLVLDGEVKEKKKQEIVVPQGHTNLMAIARSWSRASSSDGSSSITPSHHRTGVSKGMSEHSFTISRRHEVVKAAAAGIPDNQSAGTSRPASSYIADMREVGSASVPNRTGWADEEEEEEEEYNSDLSLSKLSSAPVH